MSSHDTKNPNGGVNMRHVIEPPDPNEHLLERIFARRNMRKAWKRVKANKGAAGVDGISVEESPEWLHDRWEGIRESLLDGAYKPLPVLRVEIPKPDGGTRPLGIPTILDRLIQQAISQVMVPIFDPGFSESSFGFRPGRLAHNAVRKVQEYIREGYSTAVDMDLSKFFDTVNHDALMHRVSRKIRDKCLLCLIGKYLRAAYRRPVKGFRRAGRCRLLWLISFWMILIKSLRGVGISSCVMRTTLSFWLKARVWVSV